MVHKDSDWEPSAVGPRGLARRKALLDAAECLFVEKGFEKTTLSDIINTAGGSRATLYEQFGDKDGLFRAMMEENSARILDGMAAIHADDTVPPEVALTKFALYFVQVLSEPQTASILRILVSEGGRVPDIAEAFFRIGPETTVARLAHYLKSLADAGALRIDDPDVAAQAFLGMITGNIVVRRLILPHQPLAMADVDHYVRQAIALFLSGTRVAGAEAPSSTNG
ncbi:TetR/AcrR family transcriptional regulator [Azospirillum canadense]|uniref:TetR/AcrR family transcriptional regulator n=1 Tax=Azospirillum canadense TaxID=403962 RepID=UPI002227543D|nr:TetR/AcrR family transcriptional regulator [Azospirillum canadense]MCW2238777.1 AcrR family transcriptional regulator [Azospirillum canadense]